jgi:two-component system phosphate regulon sensor histidine kinase PhoR
LFGYDHLEMGGKTPGMLIAPRDVPAFDGALQALMTQRTTMHLEVNAMRREGGEFEAEVALAPIEDGGRLIGMVCDIRDVSLFKEVERLKDAFVSNVSHELRTPIASLRLNSALMRSNPDKQEVYLDRQARDLDRLGNLIDNLLQLSRLDQKQAAIVLMPLDLAGWAQSLLDDFRPLVVDHGLTLQFDPGRHLPPVKADSSFLGQVLVNLLTNAINYTPRGGSITVTMHARRARGKSWAGFSVRDSGPGISPEDQERLFERFFRGSVGRAASARGTGLGLSIAQEIVSLHHGEIEVESSGVAGEGTIFRVWLPARGRPARPAKRHP